MIQDETTQTMKLRFHHYAIFGAAVFAATSLSGMAVLPDGRISIIQPTAGIVLGTLLMASRKHWWALLLVAVIANLADTIGVGGGEPVVSIVFAIGMVLEGLAGALMFRAFVPGVLTQFRIRELSFFVLVCAVGATAVGAGLQAAGVFARYQIGPGGPFLSLWLARAVGALVAGGPLLAIAVGRRGTDHPGMRLAETLSLAGITMLATWFSLGPGAPTTGSVIDFPYLMVPVLMWATVRYDMRVAALFVMLVSAFTVLAAATGHGPFISDDQAERISVISVQLYLVATVAATLFLSAAVGEMQRTRGKIIEDAGLHRALTENAGDMTIVFDENNTTFYASPSVRRIMGVGPDYLIGGDPFRPVHPDDVKLMTDLVEQAKLVPGDPVAFQEIRVMAGGGEFRHMEGTFTDLRHVPGLGGIVINARDISWRIEARELLRESERRFKAIAESIPIPIFITVFEDGRFVYANRHGHELVGINDESLYEHSAPEFFADPERRSELVHRLRQRGSVSDLEMTYRDVHGKILKGSISGQLLDYDGRECLLTAFFDITERKASELALKESEERFRALVDGGFGGVAVVCDRIIVESNAGLARILGFADPLDVVGHPFDEFMTEESARIATENIARGVRHPYEIVGIRADGTEFPLELMGRDATYNGKPARVTAVRDLAEHRALEEQSRTLEAKLRVSERMEAIGTLAGGIAHDFNNILVAIMGYADLTMDEVRDRPDVVGNVKQIIQATNRARDLVRQILLFSRQSEPTLVPVHLGRVVTEATRLLRATTPATIDVTSDLPDDPVYVMGDAAQIQQIVLNLGTNSLHAIGDAKGRIEIGLTVVEVDGELAEWVRVTPGRYAQLTVADTGHGMPDEIRERIFEPFFTTKKVGVGTGLGLAAVHGTVLDHGGGIRVNSEEGAGTSFDIYFPAIESPGQHEENGSRASTATGDERILFVDDEPQVTEMGQRVLESLGYTVTTSNDSEAAADLVEQDPERFQLLFTDQTMPRMTGLELIDRIRAVAPDLPVILATGYSESVTDERLTDLHINRLVMKPYRRNEIARVIREVLDNRKP